MMKKNERLLLIIAVLTGISALLYVYIIEPKIIPMDNASLSSKNKQYFEIYNRKDEIRKHEKELLTNKYFKNTVQEQQMAFQIYLENVAKESNITQIRSILPLANQNTSNEVVLQLDFECPLESLSRFLYKIGNSGVPVQVRKLQITGETEGQNTIRTQIEVTNLFLN